jgi:hypothetical protein
MRPKSVGLPGGLLLAALVLTGCQSSHRCLTCGSCGRPANSGTAPTTASATAGQPRTPATADLTGRPAGGPASGQTAEGGVGTSIGIPPTGGAPILAAPPATGASSVFANPAIPAPSVGDRPGSPLSSMPVSPATPLTPGLGTIAPVGPTPGSVGGVPTMPAPSVKYPGE